MTRIRLQAAQGLLLLVFLLAPGTAWAVDITGNYHPLSAAMQYLSDPGGQLTLDHLLATPDDHRFVPGSEGEPAASFTPVWLKIDLDFSQEALGKQYFLFTRIENLYDIRLYRPDEQGGYEEWVTGNDHPASSREMNSPRYGFSIQPSADTQTLYMRFIGGPGADRFPWDLIEAETYHRNARNYYNFDVACFSAITALLLFNLFIALSLRKAEYLYYSAYVFSVMMGLVTLDGLGFYYLWPDSPELNSRALHSFNLLSSSLRLLTVMSFLGVASFAPRMNRAALAILTVLACTFMAVNLFGINKLPPYAATLPWAAGVLFSFAICISAIWKRVQLAIPLFFALLIPSVSAIMQATLTVGSASVSVFELQLAKTGFVIHVLMFSLCLAAHIKGETESRILALHDSLTGLPGTTLLQEHFDLAANLCRRLGMKTAVFFIDLDGFKAVNDKLGHAVGDQLLVQAAGRMQSELRRTDTVARIGGDEFTVLLTQVEEEGVVTQVADKLLAAVAKPYLINGREVRVSASIGIALFPDEGEDLQSLLKAADSAMYNSKRRGKNSYTLSGNNLVRHPSQFGIMETLKESQTG